ncbi:glycosyltransferase family 4 protein [Pyrobaculum aerophilum]|uniref:glycosyltransferase family 4 protein n=1 Tax=Pyrobaculum aerophilum TaxID=13773 RepID=UPI002FD9102B
MNIAVISPQSSHWEDAHRAASILVKAFQRLGHKAWLITSIYHDDQLAVKEEVVEKSERGFVEVENDVSGVPTIRVLSSRPIFQPNIVFRNFVGILNEIDKQYDLDVIVVFSSFWNNPEEVAKWIGVRKSLLSTGEISKRATFVFVPIYTTKFPISRPIEAALRVMWSTLQLPEILRNADLIVVCCQGEAEELRLYRVPSEKIIESRCWIDPNFADLIPSVDKLRHVENFDFYVSYIGPLDEDRNLRGLVKTAEKLSSIGNIGLVVAGSGSAKERFKREIRGVKNLVLLEEYDMRTVASVMKWSLVGMDLSYFEPFGIRALEYLYAGVPFATSPTSRAVWHITNGVDGIHLEGPEDINGLVNWISTLIRDPELREEIGVKARRKAEGLNAVKLAELIISKAQR